MSFFQNVADEFRERRLWAIAAVLVIGLIAVPVVFSKSYSAPPQAPAVPPTTPQASTVPALSVHNGASTVPVNGSSRDPFTPQPGAQTTASGGSGGTAVGHGPSTTSSGASSGATGAAGTGSGAGGGSSTASQTTTSSSGTTTTTSTTTTTTTPPPPTSGLSATESYRVNLALSTPSGGLHTLNPLERLSILPSARQPMLIALGVLKGGKRLLFAVVPGTVVSGPGDCIPGPSRCEVLSLAPNQIESVAKTSDQNSSPVATFAVTAIAVRGHSSVAAAMAARSRVSLAGRALLGALNLPILAKFRYEASVGAVVDLRSPSSSFLG